MQVVLCYSFLTQRAFAPTPRYSGEKVGVRGRCRQWTLHLQFLPRLRVRLVV